MKSNYTEERFMTILWDLYYQTSNGKSIVGYKEFCKKHKITISLIPLLVKHKILNASKIETHGKGRKFMSYAWNTIVPNINMANKLKHEIIKINKELNELTKERRERIREEERIKRIKEVEDELCSGENNIQIESKVDYEFVETQSTPVEEELKTYYTIPINDPIYEQEHSTVYNTTVTATDLKSESDDKKEVKRKISIMWGLILIQW